MYTGYLLKYATPITNVFKTIKGRCLGLNRTNGTNIIKIKEAAKT